MAGLEEGKVTCKCDHLTHFGVLLVRYEFIVLLNVVVILPWPLLLQSIRPVDRSLPLEIITYIGTGLSLVCVVVMLLTYLCSRYDITNSYLATHCYFLLVSS